MSGWVLLGRIARLSLSPLPWIIGASGMAAAAAWSALHVWAVVFAFTRLSAPIIFSCAAALTFVAGLLVLARFSASCVVLALARGLEGKPFVLGRDVGLAWRATLGADWLSRRRGEEDRLLAAARLLEGLDGREAARWASALRKERPLLDSSLDRVKSACDMLALPLAVGGFVNVAYAVGLSRSILQAAVGGLSLAAVVWLSVFYETASAAMYLRSTERGGPVLAELFR